MEIWVKSGRVEPKARKFGSSRVVDRAKTSGQLKSGSSTFLSVLDLGYRTNVDFAHLELLRQKQFLGKIRNG